MPTTTTAIDELDQISRTVLAGLTDWNLADADPAAIARSGLVDRMHKPGFRQWLTDARKLGGCTQPVRLVGEVLTIDGTGRILDRFNTDTLPDRILYKPCGTRRAALCPSCSETYRWDTYQLIRAGLAGGKGVPETVATHPAVFPTLTAPSFGLVHSRIVDRRTGAVKLCRPRRDKPLCPHGRPLFCHARHHEQERRVGQPFCLDCYDHDHQVVWNFVLPALWDRTMTRLRRLVTHHLGRALARQIKLRYAKVAETQARGVMHLHALIRVDGYDPDDPEAILPPPSFLTADGQRLPVLDAHTLATVVAQAVTDTGLQAPGTQEHPAGWPVVWGEQCLTKIVHAGMPGGEITETHVAGYLAKYATKSTEAAGFIARRLTPSTIGIYANDHTHVGRLIDACWRIGAPIPGATAEVNAERPYLRMRKWAHMLGFAGHFASKSRRYSTTMTALRHARTTHARGLYTSIGPERLDHDPADEDTTLVLASWRYQGTGWLTDADLALATLAADAARKRQPAGTTRH